jgi:hypothetical protein
LPFFTLLKQYVVAFFSQRFQKFIPNPIIVPIILGYFKDIGQAQTVKKSPH